MTEQEAKLILDVRISRFDHANDVNEALEVAKTALEEIQQYRALGTVDEIEFYIRLAEKMNVCDLVRENARLSNELRFKELELREAREKQVPKKPIIHTGTNRADCPVCGATARGISKPFGNWCSRCGQAIDWSEEE